VGKVEMIVDSKAMATLLEYLNQLLNREDLAWLHSEEELKEAYGEVSKAYIKATPIREEQQL